MVIAICGIQSRRSDRTPISDMLGMIDILKSDVHAEYLAMLVFQVEQETGTTVDMFPDWDDVDDHSQEEIEYGARFDTSLADFRTAYTRGKELSESGAFNGSNVIDFVAYKCRRDLAASAA
ncbi:hypothetical protein [Ochrobactrum sp. 19YEA23]|uniref:hypothetical protein n=1 Tax=Ochrobactrum sp. 19YEA23 TaxID=3039854 RepID=UPI0024787DCB